MLNVDLFGSDLRFTGVLDVRRTPKGMRINRLPMWAQAQVSDPAFAFTASMPSGSRIEFVTDSRTIELDVQLMRVATGDQPVVPAVFDLVVDGELTDVRYSDTGHVARLDPRDRTRSDLVRGEPDTIVFDGLTEGTKHVELWLAHNAGMELRGLRLDDGASVRAPEPDTRRRWIHYGSSISHCMEADRPTGVWPVVAAHRADVNLRSFGIGGQAHLDQAVARTIRDLDADVISMKVGINVINGDTMRERTFVPAVHGFIDTVRDGHPDTPLILISPIICPAAEDRPGPTLLSDGGTFYTIDRADELMTGALTLARIRELLAMVVEQRADPNLHLMSGLDLFGGDDVADLPDGLHPNAAGYRRMGERFHARAFGPGGVFAG